MSACRPRWPAGAQALLERRAAVERPEFADYGAEAAQRLLDRTHELQAFIKECGECGADHIPLVVDAYIATRTHAAQRAELAAAARELSDIAKYAQLLSKALAGLRARQALRPNGFPAVYPIDSPRLSPRASGATERDLVALADEAEGLTLCPNFEPGSSVDWRYFTELLVYECAGYGLAPLSLDAMADLCAALFDKPLSHKDIRAAIPA